ncbi:hydroxyisourate hydrolase [Leucobacter sp. HY1908]
MSQITTHILDASRGLPAAGVTVQLLRADGSEMATGTTNADGRIKDLGPDSLDPGDYRLTFAVRSYFAGQGVEAFYPSVSIDFTVADSTQHYHVPILLSPFAYSTYRGS